MKITLPLPPSANHLFRNGSVGGKPRRFKTSAYSQWQQTAAIYLKDYRDLRRFPKGDKTRWKAAILAGIDYRRDVDGVIKPLLDFLVQQSLTPDDRWCEEVAVRRDPTIKGFISVEITFIA